MPNGTCGLNTASNDLTNVLTLLGITSCNGNSHVYVQNLTAAAYPRWTRGSELDLLDGARYALYSSLRIILARAQKQQRYPAHALSRALSGAPLHVAREGAEGLRTAIV